jgi:hypothetical protein
MSRAVLFRIFVVTAVSVALIATPRFAFAQRGGGSSGFHSGGGFHGGGGFRSGGGGFHGGGNFSGFRGSGGNFSGFRGGNFGGFRNRGFDGFHRRYYGGFRGYPGYGYGFSFGFYPYWGYPYWYGYGPWWGPYSYYAPYGLYDYPDDRDDSPYDHHPRDNRDRCDYRYYEHTCRPDGQSRPAKPSNTGVPESPDDPNYVTTNLGD